MQHDIERTETEERNYELERAIAGPSNIEYITLIASGQGALQVPSCPQLKGSEFSARRLGHRGRTFLVKLLLAPRSQLISLLVES
jgi:hypothetical protein